MEVITMKAYIVNLQGKKISKTATTEEGINKLRDKITIKLPRKNSNVLVIKN